MKNLILFLLLFLASAGCNEDSNSRSILSESLDSNIELRSCWWCISEDVLGMIEGGFAGGSVAGPMGAAVGGALVGAYRSIKEYNSQPRVSLADSPDFLSNLSNHYTENKESNEFNDIGLLHNEILHALILNKDDLNSTLEYYEFMEDFLKSRFPNFEFTNEFREVILGLMQSVDDGENIETTQEYETLYNNLESAFKSQDEPELLQLIEQYEVTFVEDQIAMQGISTAYHTWYFWKNL